MPTRGYPYPSDHRYADASLLPTQHLRPRLGGIIAPHLPDGPGKVDRPAQDNRLFINAVFCIFRTGALWRDLPHDYGHWNAIHSRFARRVVGRPRGLLAG